MWVCEYTQHIFQDTMVLDAEFPAESNTYGTLAGAEVDRGSQCRGAMSARRAFGRQQEQQQRETLEGNQLETPNQAAGKGSRTGRKERKKEKGRKARERKGRRGLEALEKSREGKE